MGLFSWRRRLDLDEDDFREEVRAHLALAREEKIADGASGEDAYYEAVREFGNVTLTTEAARGVWTPRWLERFRDLLSDVRYGVRSVAKNPVFSLAVIGVLTLGIGLNAAVFTMLKGMALAPIAGVDGSAQLVVVHAETSAGRPVRLSYPDFQHLQQHDRAFTGLFGTVVIKTSLGRGRGARQIWGELVTGRYFELLGVGAERGRTLLPSDEVAPGRHPVVVVSEGLWRRDFDADPNIVGSTIEINNVPLTVVGVAAASFHGTTVVYDVEVFIPLMMGPQLGFSFGSTATTAAAILNDPRAALVYPTGYLRPGVTLSEAAAQAQALWAARAAESSAAEISDQLRIVPFLEAPGGAPSFGMPTLTVLIAMGLLVLAIACANLAGLVLVRAMSRRGEIAVRLALGASRLRIVRLLIVENLVLALPGALFGVLLARFGMPLLVGYAERLAAPLRIHFNTDVDALVVGFAVLAACGSVLLFGFLPSWRSARVDLVAAINEDASPRGAPRGRFRAGLVVAQVAVSLLLLVGAGLATRSVDAARRADPGFDARGATAISIDVRQNGYDRDRGRIFYRRLLEAVRADPTVEAASLATFIPLSMTDTRVDRVEIDGYDANRGVDLAFMSNVVSPDYFRTLRIPLVAGREFDETDDEQGQPVVIVNRTMAARFWTDAAAAVGKRIRVNDGTWRTIVGVASDVKYSRIEEGPRSYFYLPFGQTYRSAMVLHTRGTAAGDTATAALVSSARAHIEGLDPDLPILAARTLGQAIRGALIFLDLTATMLLVFGATGIALAAMGTYGLVSYSARQRTHEIGIRMALGASGGAVVRQFLGHGLRLGAIGAGLGLVAAVGAARLMGSVLFGVSATDAVSFLRALLVVLAVISVATLIPAWRAARTSPLTVLRHQ